MDLNEYQKKANRTINAMLNENDQIVNASAGLAVEAGEFADIVRKFRFQDGEFDRSLAIKAIGGVLWYCALAARELGTSLNDIARMNIEALESRYPEEYELDA